MALSQRGKVSLIPIVAVLMLLFAGAAQARNCAPGQKNCNGCVDAKTDVKNCGGCGVKCPACRNGLPSCQAGRCGFTCKAPYKHCGNSWANGCNVDSSNDVYNCGACRTRCIAPPNAAAKCYNGRCEYTCLAGWKNCDRQWENGCECAIDSDNNNCGACGVKCKDAGNAVSECKDKKCEYSCKAGWANCDNDWTNGCECAIDSDNNNCGACGVKCKDAGNAVSECKDKKCEYSCKAGWANCDNDWTNGCECAIDSDNNNCGACGVKCKDAGNAVSECKDKKCEYSCKAGWANCDNDWTNGCECAIDSDVNHCGGCGKKCPQPVYYGGEARCTKGKCETLVQEGNEV